MTTLVVGFGSSHGDDQIGWLVIDALRPSSDLRLFKSKGSGIDWYAEVDGCDAIIFVDAMRSGRVPGAVEIFRHEKVNDVKSFSSTHSISITDSLALARELYDLSLPVTIIGIEIDRDRPLSRVSRELESAISQVRSEIEKIIVS